MKKFLQSAALFFSLILASATGVWAAANPFMDVPLNHWAYDAIGQLAARGVLSGYPDGTYKGKQPTTRYEMASALARALAYVDMEKASKQDVEMLKKLAVEFKDELDTLGVKVDVLDGRVAVLEDRLGGWKLSGELRLDREMWDNDLANGNVILSRARLELRRWFGTDESMHFYVRIEDGGDGTDQSARFSRFYVDFPFFWDSTITVGRFSYDFESDYRFETGGVSDVINASWLTDRTVDGMAFRKPFAMGSFQMYVAHPGVNWNHVNGIDREYYDAAFEMWEITATTRLKFGERFTFDLGLQAFLGDDNSEVFTDGDSLGFKVDSVWTAFAGAQFDFNPNIALRGIYYYQNKSAEYYVAPASPLASTLPVGWHDVDTDNTNAFKVLFDVKQDFLKYTSLWLEYSQVDRGFYMPYGIAALYLHDEARWDRHGSAGLVPFDTSIWRVGAKQRWSDKWSSWLYVAGHTLEDAALYVDAAGRGYLSDVKATQWGIGVDYQMNSHVGMSFNYINIDWDSDGEAAGYKDEHRIQSRTTVTF